MMKEEIRNRILDFGADVCGFSGIDRFNGAPEGFHPCDIFKDCKSVIAFGMAIPKGIFLSEPRLIYSYYNNFVCSQTDRIAFQTAAMLEKFYHGAAVPLPSDGPYDYWNEEKMEGRGLLSMKHAAFFAGIGSFGKSSLLLNRDYGNRLVIGCVLTDVIMEADEFAPDLCLESCDLCIRNCPTGALSEKGVEQKPCRMNSYGKTKRGFDTVECNACRTVCPMRFGLI